MSDQTTTKTADVSRVDSQTPCYMATFDPAHVNCPECNLPMLYDYDHIRCCGTGCSLRGKEIFMDIKPFDFLYFIGCATSFCLYIMRAPQETSFWVDILAAGILSIFSWGYPLALLIQNAI